MKDMPIVEDLIIEFSGKSLPPQYMRGKFTPSEIVLLLKVAELISNCGVRSCFIDKKHDEWVTVKELWQDQMGEYEDPRDEA